MAVATKGVGVEVWAIPVGVSWRRGLSLACSVRDELNHAEDVGLREAMGTLELVVRADDSMDSVICEVAKAEEVMYIDWLPHFVAFA